MEIWEMGWRKAHWLRAFAAIAEDPGLIPRSYMAAQLLTPVPGVPIPSGLHRHCMHLVAYIHGCRHIIHQKECIRAVEMAQ